MNKLFKIIKPLVKKVFGKKIYLLKPLVRKFRNKSSEMPEEKKHSAPDVSCLEKHECCGCGACYNICPEEAIEMHEDCEGFLYPEIDYHKCTRCRLCYNVCPSIHPRYSNADKPECYAAWASDEIREKSSSGGMFTLFANSVFREGGSVCGARFNELWEVEHAVIDTDSDLDSLRGSKYVLGSTGKVYSEIKEKLKDSNKVLFCGCPCQVAGLYGYLGNDNENLLTIDLMCHGGPSPLVFRKYLEEVHGGKEITHIGFRDKDYYGWSTEMTVGYADGSVYRKPRTVDVFYKAFLPCISVRPHCGECKFSRLPRQGDITLADFWGVHKYNKDFDDKKGTSLMIVNSDKGRTAAQKIRNEMKMFEKVPLSYVLGLGQPFDKPFKRHHVRNRFFDLIRYSSLKKAFHYAVKRRFDVAIYGVWFGCNYGSIMTYYSLCRKIESFGLSVLMIDKPLLNRNDHEHEMNHARRFAYGHYSEISKAYRLYELGQLNRHCDTFVIGSDQVWNYGIARYFGRSTFLNFVDEDRKKIAYAPSFGHGGFYASKAETETTASLLKRFDHISVRESNGVEICRDAFGVKAERVLDPVFLVETALFEEIAAESGLNEQEEFIATYILDPTPEKREAIKHVSRQLDCKVINMLDGFLSNFDDNKDKLGLPDIVENLQVEQWLYYLRNCKYLITDSCHGASFAIIFNKPFTAIANKARGIQRFESLFSLFDIEDRYVLDAKEILSRHDLLRPFDYSKVNRILKKERLQSEKFLKKALFSDKKVKSDAVYRSIETRE